MLRATAQHIAILLLCVALSNYLRAQSALVQFIHNSADSELSTISIWMNGNTWVESIHYLESTAMVSIPAGDSVEWEIRSAFDSTVTYYSWFSSHSPDSKHIFTIHGHFQTTYEPYRQLAVEQFSQALNLSASTGSVDFLFFHGATEFDTVDVAETELFELTAFDQLPYGRFSGYLTLFPADFGWSILSADGNQNFGEYALPISELNWAGQAVTIVTSGYYNQAENNNGQSLGMWATTAAGGPLVRLQPMQWFLSSQVQFLHNATIPGSQNVRIEVDDTVWLTSLDEHSSSPFNPFPAGKEVAISIHSNAPDIAIDSLWSDTLLLSSGSRYQLIWYGGFTPETPAQLIVHAYEDSASLNGSSVRMRFFHGASQWESIRMLADTLVQSTLIEPVPYGTISDTLTIPVMNEEWLLFSNLDSLTAVQAPLDTLNVYQQTITALTCDELNDAGISLWLSRESGGPMHRLSTLIIPEPPTFCNVQWVHASSDTLLQSIDVWVNDSLLLPAFQFETVSSFTTVQCNDGVITRITKSGDPSMVYFTDTLELSPNQQHRIILWGIYDLTHYNPAPELSWYIDEDYNPLSSIAENTDLRFFHTVGDIGTIQINEASIPIVPLYNEIELGEMSNTESLAASQNYGIEVLNAPSQFLYETYALPVLEDNWANQSVTLISTGFRQPANNSNGEPLQVWALLPDGSMNDLQQFVSTENFELSQTINLFPNPADRFVRVNASFARPGWATIRVVDSFGRTVMEKKCTTKRGLLDEILEIDFLPAGIYSIRLQSETSLLSAPLIIQH